MGDKRKVAVIGTGMVGMSYAYALLNQNICNELCLIDINKERAMGEAMDLNHGLAFSGAHMKIYSGEYGDCSDADIVVVAAGVSQKPGESRPDLLTRNTAVFKSIISPVVAGGFDGLFLIATNPVDIMTQVTQRLSGFPPEKVFGSGTTLDTARLRYLLGDYFKVDPRNIHAYVMGEHGETEFVAWSQAMLATKPIKDICDECSEDCSGEKLKAIGRDVKDAAQVIINAKSATYYGIGMALARITKAVFGDEKSVMTVSAKFNGEYGIDGVYAGAPSVVGRHGIEKIVTIPLSAEELEKLRHSAETLKEIYSEIRF